MKGLLKGMVSTIDYVGRFPSYGELKKVMENDVSNLLTLYGVLIVC